MNDHPAVKEFGWMASSVLRRAERDAAEARDKPPQSAPSGPVRSDSFASRVRQQMHARIPYPQLRPLNIPPPGPLSRPETPSVLRKPPPQPHFTYAELLSDELGPVGRMPSHTNRAPMDVALEMYDVMMLAAACRFAAQGDPNSGEALMALGDCLSALAHQPESYRPAGAVGLRLAWVAWPDTLILSPREVRNQRRRG